MFQDQNKFISSVLAAHIRGVVMDVLPSIAAPSTESVEDKQNHADVAGKKMFRENTVLGMAVRRIFDLHYMEHGDEPVTREFIKDVIESDAIVRRDVGAVAMGLAKLSKNAYTVLRENVAPAVETIMNNADTRTNRLLSGESGITEATVESYSWGCLSDPLFVNVMLGACYDLSNTFTPDVPVREFYHSACATKARDHKTKSLEGQARDAAVASIESLGLEATMQDRALDLLTRARGLQNTVNNFTESYNRSALGAIGVLEELKSVVETMDAVEAACRLKGMELSAEAEGNLEAARSAVYLMHGAIYTKRETAFKTMIHLGTVSGEDGKVLVYANEDLVPAYEAAGGSMQELATLGRFLDMRKNADTKRQASSIDMVRKSAANMAAQVESFDKNALAQYRSSELATYRTSLSAALTAWANDNTDALHVAMDPIDLRRSISAAVAAATRDANRLSSTESITNIVMHAIPGKVAETLRRSLSDSYRDRAAVESFTDEIRREAQAEAVGNLVMHVLEDYMK